MYKMWNVSYFRTFVIFRISVDLLYYIDKRLSISYYIGVFKA